MIKTVSQPRKLVWLALGLASVSLTAADVDYFGVIKSSMYTQAVGVAVAPITHTNAYTYTSFVIGSSNGAVSDATVRIPNGSTKQLSTNQTDNLLGALLQGTDAVWIFTTNFATSSALDSAFPSSPGVLFPPQAPSEYTVNMSTLNDGLQSQKLSCLGLSTPPTPTIANLSAAQAIETRTNFTLFWNSVAGGLIPKIVMLTILDHTNNVLYSSPAPFTTGALDGNSTSVTITNGTLPPGASLWGHLIVFQPALPNTNYAIGVIGLLRDTAFPLATLPLPRPAAAQLVALTPTNQTFRLQIQLEANQTYHIEGSDTLTNWINLLITNSPSGTVLFVDPDSPALPRRFYRVVAP